MYKKVDLIISYSILIRVSSFRMQMTLLLTRASMIAIHNVFQWRSQAYYKYNNYRYI